MLQRRKAMTAAAVLAVVGLLGCAQDDQWSEAVPDNQGYRWVGEGEPGNFGSAYSFCQSTQREANLGARLQGTGGLSSGTSGAGITTGARGGPLTVPGLVSGQQTFNPSVNTVADRRQFQGCMESQGWALQEAASTPAAASPPAGAPPPAPKAQ